MLPLADWCTRGVHWHGYVRESEGRRRPRAGDRARRLATTPDAVLRTPDEAAAWPGTVIEQRIGLRRVWGTAENRWIDIGDQADRTRWYRATLRLTSRGNGLHTGVLCDFRTVELFLEAVTADDCPGH